MNPQVFCNYTLLDELGHSGISTVYRARDNRNSQIVALKRLNREMQHDPRARARFRRDPRYQVRHPKIVPVIEADTCNATPYFTMEWVTGESLDKLIQRGPLSPQQLAPYLRDVAEALDTAHQRGIIHRDIKPSNILIRQDGVALLTDFGVAKLAIPSTLQAPSPSQSQSPIAKEGPISSSGLLLAGTAEFVSPEVARGNGDVGIASDIYSLGVTAYLALAGHLPFIESNPLVLLHRHANESAPSLHSANPNIPKAVSRVVMKALNKDPHERYASASAFAQDFAEAVMQSQAATPSSLHRRSIWMGGVAILLLAIIAAVLLQAQARRNSVTLSPTRSTAPSNEAPRSSIVPITVALPAPSPAAADTAAPSALPAARTAVPTAAIPTEAIPPEALPTTTATAQPTQTPAPRSTASAERLATATREATATQPPSTPTTPSATPDPLGSANTFEVIYNGGGYMRWGTPKGACGADGFDDTQPLWRFEVSLTLKNSSPQATLNTFAAQFSDSEGKGAPTCVVQGSGPLSPNTSATVKLATYTDHQNVQSVLISMDGGKRRLCFNGINAALC